MGCGGEKLLCARRMLSLLLIARPASEMHVNHAELQSCQPCSQAGSRIPKCTCVVYCMVHYMAAIGVLLGGVVPFMSGGNSAVKSFKLVSSAPSCMSGLLRSTDRMACVAHALVITCRAKNTFPKYSDSPTAARSSCSLRHLKRKTRPYTGLRKAHNCYPCIHSF